MSLNPYPTGVPCLVCHERIVSWDAFDLAVPCGHSHDENMDEAARALAEIDTKQRAEAEMLAACFTRPWDVIEPESFSGTYGRTYEGEPT